MIDVATRWAYFVPLEKPDSFSVVRAVEDRIIGDGSFPRMFITDNGSEFKKTFTEFCELYSIKVRRSVPHHAEGHGLVEAANRTIADVIGHMIEEDGGDWEDNLAWSRRAYLSSIHTALQGKSGAGISPQEAFMRRTVQMPLEIRIQEALELGDQESPAQAIGLKAKETVRKALAWVQEGRDDYERSMRDTKRNRNRRERVFQLGDKVRLYRPPKHKTARKVGRVFVGPYMVVDVLRHANVPSEYILRREGGAWEARVRAKAEDLRSYVDSSAQASRQTAEQLAQLVSSAPSRQYTVKAILGERGSSLEGTKAFLIDWGEGWEPTWQPETLVKAPDLLADFHVTKHKPIPSRLASQAIQARVVSSVQLPLASTAGQEEGGSLCVQMDLLRWGPVETWDRLMREAKVDWEDMLLVWVSPPCQIFSPADYSNISCGHAYRDHSVTSKPPTQVNVAKALTARLHDQLVQQVLAMQEYAMKRVSGILCLLENPRGSLVCRDYMQPGELNGVWERLDVDQCAFGREYRKATHLWHNSPGLRLQGVTGDGKCHGKCGKGKWVNGHFQHVKALAMEPWRGPVGPGHTKEKNALPQMLLGEILDRVLKRPPSAQARVVVDLCAGFQSWRPVVEERGCRYIVVDLLGDRNRRKGGVGMGTRVLM